MAVVSAVQEVTEVLLEHRLLMPSKPRKGCRCGWRPFGTTHAQHVAEELEALGLLASPDPNRRVAALLASLTRVLARRSGPAPGLCGVTTPMRYGADVYDHALACCCEDAGHAGMHRDATTGMTWSNEADPRTLTRRTRSFADGTD